MDGLFHYKRELKMQKISRRTLAKLASAAAALPMPAQQLQKVDYSGPLTGVDQKAAGRGLDPLPYALRLLDEAPRQLRFSSRNKSQAEDWQRRLRAKVTELVGGFPASGSPLRPITLERREFPRYRREKLIFDSRNGVSVL